MNFDGDGFGWCSRQLLAMWLVVLSGDYGIYGKEVK